MMLSARGRASEFDEGLQQGADAYITKPFGTRELLDGIARLLRR
jgi:DNA-binding response OmpR family regulator